MGAALSAAPLSVFRVVRRTRAEGPGVRAALWLQGCSIRCPGCFNAHLWPAVPPNRDALKLASELVAIDGIEGITVLGGEPFDQAESLAELAERVRLAGLSVMVFTGFTLSELRARRRAGVDRLLGAIDLLVDGRYDASQPERTRPWIGSTNQVLHQLTDRYRGDEARWAETPDRLEVRIQPDGAVFVNGMGSSRQLAAVRHGIRSAGAPA